jgi:hypothetical protein
MTIDRETSNHPAPGTPKMSVIQGGKGKTAKGKTKQRSAPDAVTGLTEKQEAFAQGIMDGMTYTAAYKAAYVADGMADSTIWSRACELAADSKVTARLHQLKALKEAERRMQEVSRSGFRDFRASQDGDQWGHPASGQGPRSRTDGQDCRALHRPGRDRGHDRPQRG